METKLLFDQTDQRVLRYLEKKWISRGGNCFDIMPEDIQRDNGLGAEQCARMIARFKQLGILDDVSLDGTLGINDIVCQYVAELERQPPPDYLDKAKKWAFSKPWLVFPGIILLILLPWCVGIVQMVKSLLEWFGVR